MKCWYEIRWRFPGSQWQAGPDVWAASEEMAAMEGLKCEALADSEELTGIIGRRVEVAAKSSASPSAQWRHFHLCAMKRVIVQACD